MATISALPTPQEILAMRGRLDYYDWRGIICVRSWPKKSSIPQTPASSAAAATFADFSQRVASTAPNILTQIAALPGNETWTARDALTSAIYGHAYH